MENNLLQVWRGCKLRIIAIAQENDNNLKMQQELQQYVYQLRIDAKILVAAVSPSHYRIACSDC